MVSYDDFMYPMGRARTEYVYFLKVSSLFGLFC